MKKKIIAVVMLLGVAAAIQTKWTPKKAWKKTKKKVKKSTKKTKRVWKHRKKVRRKVWRDVKESPPGRFPKKAWSATKKGAGDAAGGAVDWTVQKGIPGAQKVIYTIVGDPEKEEEEEEEE